VPSTASDADDPRQVFRVNHPFHPLLGREFRVVDLRNTWGEDRVYFHDDEGRLRYMPTSWTNAAAEDPFVSVSAGRSLFRASDLPRLVDLVAGLAGETGSVRKDGRRGRL
jgi:hypothetical protein